MLPRSLEDRLRAATDKELLALLLSLDDATCRLVLERLVPKDCNCAPDPLPCPEHGDCDCLVTFDRIVYCEHVFDYVLPDWAEAHLLWRVYPETYAEPPPPEVPSKVLLQEARVSVLEERLARGRGLYHPGDLVRRRRPSEPGPYEILRCRRPETNGPNGDPWPGILERCA